MAKTSFSKAEFQEADLRGATIGKDVDLQEADFTGARLFQDAIKELDGRGVKGLDRASVE